MGYGNPTPLGVVYNPATNRRAIEGIDPIAGAQCGDLGWQRYSRPEPALRHLKCAPGGLAAGGDTPAYANSIKACPEPAEPRRWRGMGLT